MDTILQGTNTEVRIGSTQPTVIIGNRIHAARNARIADAVRRMDMSMIQQEAITQAEEGAQVIGVWLGIEGVDEAQALVRLVESVAEVVPLPLCLGSRDPKALEAALEACPGKPLQPPALQGPADSRRLDRPEDCPAHHSRLAGQRRHHQGGRHHRSHPWHEAQAAWRADCPAVAGRVGQDG